MGRLPLSRRTLIYVLLVAVITVCFLVSGRERKENWITAGAVRVTSGQILIDDPSYVFQDVEDGPEAEGVVVIEGISPGMYDVEILKGNLGWEWGHRVVEARFPIREDAFKGAQFEKRSLGKVWIDSAQMVIIDPAHVEKEWVEEGPRRDGLIMGTDRNQIAELLKENGFQIGGKGDWTIALADPVSEADEDRADDLIKASGLRGFVSIRTGSTYEKVADVLEGTSDWGTIPFNKGDTGLLVAFTSGIGDGDYPVYGVYDGETIVGIIIDLLPEDDKDS